MVRLRNPDPSFRPETLPMRTIRKNVAEQNKQGGSNTLLLAQVQTADQPALVQFDYFPTAARSNFVSETEEKIKESKGSATEAVLAMSKWSMNVGSVSFMQEGSDDINAKAAGGGGGWKAVNYLLGVVCFGLVVYLMILLRGDKGRSGGGGGGLFGGRGKSKGKSGSPFGGGGRSGGGRMGGGGSGRGGGRRR